jgi:hypothetical protein
MHTIQTMKATHQKNQITGPPSTTSGNKMTVTRICANIIRKPNIRIGLSPPTLLPEQEHDTCYKTASN